MGRTLGKRGFAGVEDGGACERGGSAGNAAGARRESEGLYADGAGGSGETPGMGVGSGSYAGGYETEGDNNCGVEGLDIRVIERKRGG